MNEWVKPKTTPFSRTSSKQHLLSILILWLVWEKQVLYISFFRFQQAYRTWLFDEGLMILNGGISGRLIEWINSVYIDLHKLSQLNPAQQTSFISLSRQIWIKSKTTLQPQSTPVSSKVTLVDKRNRGSWNKPLGHKGQNILYHRTDHTYSNTHTHTSPPPRVNAKTASHKWIQAALSGIFFVFYFYSGVHRNVFLFLSSSFSIDRKDRQKHQLDTGIIT